MTKFGTVTFTGSSGQNYTFSAYYRDTTFNSVGAVYFMTKRAKKSDNTFSHTRIYVGETGDLSNRPLNHHRKACFDRNGANCVCIYLENNQKQRYAIEHDLLEKYDPPCNLE